MVMLDLSCPALQSAEMTRCRLQVTLRDHLSSDVMMGWKRRCSGAGQPIINCQRAEEPGNSAGGFSALDNAGPALPLSCIATSLA